MKKYITEFIGTFFLVLVVGLNGNAGPSNLIAIGSILMVMIYAGGHISGAHYNPAVTLAVFLRGKIEAYDAGIYMVVQVLGGILAAIIVNHIFHVGGNGTQPQALGWYAALAAELLGTFALAYVVLNVATAKANTGSFNSFYGLAIGFTVVACGYVLGKYSGGAFNPAVAIGQSVGGFFLWNHIWIYLVGCFGGAAVAALVFNYNNPNDN